jgi:ubiquinone/menaquinone biosynthesis C-methylase UbiE
MAISDIANYLDREMILDLPSAEIMGSNIITGEELARLEGCDDFTKYSLVASVRNGFTLYDRMKGRQRQGVFWTLERLKSMKGTLPNNPRILDVCCGTGLESVFLASQFSEGRIVGLDYIPAMVSRAAERASGYDISNASFVVSDRDRLPIPESSTNLLFCLNSFFEGDPNMMRRSARDDLWLKRIDEFMRVMKNGSQIAISYEMVSINNPQEITIRDYHSGQVSDRLAGVMGSRGLRDLVYADKCYVSADNLCWRVMMITGRKS